MGVKSFTNFRKSKTEDGIAESSVTPGASYQQNLTSTADVENRDEKPEEIPDENAQTGVQDIEAMTLAWTKTSLVSLFVL